MKGARDQVVMFSNVSIATSGSANMVVGWWEKDLKSDLQLMDLDWRNDEAKLRGFKIDLELHLYHLREVVELITDGK